MRKAVLHVTLLLASILPFQSLFAQGPGYIIRQAGATNLGSGGSGVFASVATTSGQAILNPDYGSGSNALNYATKSTYTGQWTPSDDVTNSEIPYAAIPPYSSEPYADLRRGPAHLYSDFVPSGRTSDLGASYYMYFRGSSTVLDSALCFRLRMGTVMPGAKGYSILIDADGKFGATGPNADPNYVAATTGVNGNPGFELEVDLFTQTSGQTGIALYNVDGSSSPTLVWSANDYTQFSQVTIAGTNDNGDPDFYLDFFVPWNKISTITSLGITTSSTLRFIPTTVMAPQAAIGGPKSDIYGLNDNSYPNANVEYETLLSAMPGFSITQLASTGAGSIPNSGNTQLCTAAPTVSTVTTTGGANLLGQVTGTWSKLSISTVSSTTITIKRTTSAGVTTTLGTKSGVNSGAGWTFDIPVGTTLNTGDKIYAQAQSTGENACQLSNTVLVTACSNATWVAAAIPAPAGGGTSQTNCLTTGTTTKGIDGGNRTNSAWTVYINDAYTGTTQNSTSNQGSSAFANNGSTTTFTSSATPNWTYSNGCQGGSSMTNGAYTLWYQDANGCKSEVTPLCVKGSLAGTVLAPTVSPSSITTSTTAVTVTGAAGSTISLYFDGEVIATGTIPGTFNNTTTGTIMFSGLTFQTSGSVYALASRITSGTIGTSYCVAKSTAQTVALCTTPPPAITVNNTTGFVTTGSAITGTGIPGSTINLYSGATLLATMTVATSGQWTTSGATLSNGFSGTSSANTTYYATAQNGTCSVSANSANASTAASTTSGRCGSITTSSITTSTTTIAGTLVSSATSTTVNLYEDGYLIGSQTGIASTTNWTISVSNLYPGDGYSTGKLTIGIQETGKDEQICDTSSVKAFVGCTRPAAASLTYSSCTNCGGSASTVKVGGTVTYTVGDATNPAVPGYFYSLRNPNTGQSLSTGVWASSTSFTITTDPVTSTGTFAVELVESSVSSSAVCTGSGTASRTYVVLPVNIISFTGTKVNSSNVLSWKTGNELNTQLFEIEKSTDGVNFIKIGSVQASGSNSNYSFTDANISNVNYYRLRIVDIDGRITYSRTIVLRENGSSVVLNSIRPNPFYNELKLSIMLSQMQTVSVSLIDASGRQVAVKEIAGVNGLNEIILSDLSHLSAGVYTVRVFCNNTSFQEKVLKGN